MLEKLHKMMIDGELTPYLYSVAKDRLHYLPLNLQQQMLEDIAIMSAIGVDSEDDHKHFMYVSMHTKSIADDIGKKQLSSEELAKVSSIVFSNRHINTIDTIYNFYKATEAAFKIIGIPIKKVAYPLGFGAITPDSQYDISKWMTAMREIYAIVHRGMAYDKAFDKVTHDWDTMEKQDFKTWQRFYHEGAHQKYKTAQNNAYYNTADGSPLIPFKDLRSKIPGMSDVNMSDLPLDIAESKRLKKEQEIQNLNDKNNLIEDIKKKLISRLTSAERLITDRAARDDLNAAIDMGLDKWLETLHALKRSIQTAPMKNVASPILQDLIIKRGNQLSNEGYVKSGNFLIALAQETKAPPVDELEPSTDEMMPEMPEMPEMPDMAEEENDDKAMDDFVRGLNHEHFEDESDLDDELVVEAQALPEDPQAMEAALMGQEADIEVSDKPEREILEDGDTLDVALANITVEDVIHRLELVANIIQNREIPRQLSFVDMMLGKLGLATFFPSLGEAIRSALESHQYMYTRIEDIQSKLRGSVQPKHQIDLTTDITDETASTETMENIRQNLNEAERSERAKSDQRKAQREAKEQAAQVAPTTPAVVAPELAAPVEVESAPPVRAI